MKYTFSKIELGIALLITAGVSSCLTVFGFLLMLGLDGTGTMDLLRFFGTKYFIEYRYVDEVDRSKLMDGAINGMMDALDDPHSVYLNPTSYQQLMEHTGGSFGGIGVTMGFKDNKVTIISVLEGTPGEQAGLKAGDEILAVDGTSVTEWPSEEVALHIRGEIGTTVTLTIRRPGESDADYSLTRDSIKVPTVKGMMLEGSNLGYIRVATFAENTGQEFAGELDKLEQQGMKGLIIDLRENPGGLITSCVEIAQLVVPEGPIVSVVERDGSKDQYDSELKESKYPIVVLMDGNSASASEILAGALQDTGAAAIVGTQSYGKGSVQVVVPLFQEDGLKLTVAKYYTPAGRSIDGIGITPDVVVELPATATEDLQLEKAKEVLQDKLAGRENGSK